MSGFVLSSVAGAQNAPTLRSSLEIIRAQLARQGPIAYSMTTHDSATGRTWTNRVVIEASQVVVDEPQCRVGYHWKTTLDGKGIADLDTGMPFAAGAEVTLISMSEDMAQSVTRQGHDTWGVSVQPQVWVVHLTRTDGTQNTVDFRDKASAQVTVDAMRQAMKLCR